MSDSPHEITSPGATEPPPGSVILTDGPTGTAWQRHFKDGMWHSTAHNVHSWAYLVLRGVRKKNPIVVIYVAPRGES